MDTYTHEVYDQEGNLVESEIIEVPVPPERIEREEALADYVATKKQTEAGSLSMVKLRDRLDALEAVVATLIPELKDGE